VADRDSTNVNKNRNLLSLFRRNLGNQRYMYSPTSDLLGIGKGNRNGVVHTTSRSKVDQGIANMLQGGPGAVGCGHGLWSGGSGEIAGPWTGVVDHVDQGQLATSNSNRTMKSFS
jgi:hypothetical protein